MKTTNTKILILASLSVLVATFLLGACSAVGQLTGSSGTPAADASQIPVVTEAPTITSEGRLVPSEDLALSFSQPGPVAEVLVEEGQQVKAGDVLARQGEREKLQAAIEASNLELVQAQQALNTLQENADVAAAAAQQAMAAADKELDQATQALDNIQGQAKQVDIDAAAATVVLTRKALDDAIKDFRPYENKPENNVVRARYQALVAAAQKAYDNAVTRYNNLTGTSNQYDLALAKSRKELAQANLDEAQREYDKVKGGPNPDDLALAQARLSNAQAQLAAAQTALDNSELLAPMNGTITQVSIDPGQLVTAFQPVMEIADLETWYVETSDLTEIDVVQIDAQAPVTVTPDALPDLDIQGHIERISQGYEEKAGDVLYTVRIRLDESDPRLRWGMTVSVTFQREQAN
jgi:multidrug efflux pump subunit AcrA (membrane-fusion protein)